ncbi:lacticin 481 family lantibiotic [Streptococcus pyogenes]|uniref:lacticin 481 family lantibiotic n=1 Tax=Streptococcus pyogenes TaxID=1314 RepID=UPI0010A1F16B|nr:lacticin 481 family lantibiotic [Streptococcus pyogenes]VGV73580.1 putative type-A lantibiotic [Streptococcus pyogenes]VGV91435.1 putative type-A lantibiotic [Streptococcus pyogenes]
MEEKMCLGALNVLQEFQIEELDNLLGGGGHGVNTISAECRWNSLQAIFTCC